jgi:DNA sulfur modification protein DndD
MQFKISSIEITNFRQYEGTQEINLKFDKTKNVSIVIGNNGAGKSNLLNAITWCLYGIEIHENKNIEDSGEEMPIINTSVLKATQTTQQKTFAEVTIHLETDKGPWRIKRRIEGKKDSSGHDLIDDSNLTVVHPSGTQDIVDSGQATQMLINNLLPSALKNFFFMDGEQLQKLFHSSTPQKTAEAIDNISQLDLVKQSRLHLSKVESALRNSKKNTDPQLQQVQGKIEHTQQELDKNTKAIEKIGEILEKDNQELITVKDYLKTHNSTELSKLASERDDKLVPEINQIKSALHLKESQRNSYLVEIAPFILLKDVIEESYHIIEEKVEKGELPPRIKETFIKELLDKGTCICGTELSSDGRKVLEAYRKRAALSELSEISIIGKTEISEILADIQQFPDKMDIFNADLQDLESRLKTNEMRIQQISEILKDSNIAEIIQNEDRRDDLIRLNGNNELKLKMLYREKETLESELSKLKVQEKTELTKDKKNSVLKTKLTLVQSAIKTLENTENIIKTNIRKQVEEWTDRNFKTLIRKTDTFEKTTIDENYKVKVHHVDGYNAINHLSAGESEILGLAFMSSLMKISGFQAPVIIDTPLAKIDNIHTDLITTSVPAFLHGTQLILLVTPKEYNEKVREELSKYLLKDNCYRIIDENKKLSKIVSCHDN